VRMRRGELGVSLVEVMVSLVVVSLGMGGVLLAQAGGLASVTGAGYRMQAAMLAEHLLDRARANPTESYAIGTGPAPTAGTIAARDLATWKRRLGEALPEGDGEVRHEPLTDAGSGTRFERLTVLVGWSDRRSGADETGEGKRRHLLLHGYRAMP
jgi:type IV pilus assembly protein PilV